MQPDATAVPLPSGIQVWQIDLSHVDVDALQAARSVLSMDEQARLARFHREQDRKRFAVSRAALRLLLAERLHCAPPDIVFAAGPYGKLSVAASEGASAPFFNLSHSGDFVLIALSETGEIGIDIEYRDPELDVGSIVSQVLSEQERCSEQIRPLDFFARWVGKEAALKALGVGVGEHLQALSVESSDDGAYRLSHTRSDWAGISAWQLASPPGYAAAVALVSVAVSVPVCVPVSVSAH